MKPCQNAEGTQARRPVSRLFGVLILVTAGFAVPTCLEYQYPGLYYCDETNNCADVPTTICQADINECLCPSTDHLWCYKHRRCMPEEECFPEAGAPCDAGGGGEGGGVGGGGGSAGSDGGG